MYTFENKPTTNYISGIQYIGTEIFKILSTENNKKLIIEESEDAKPTNIWTFESK